MINDGRISRIIPHVYYHEENDLIRFVDALDAEAGLLEKKIAGITDLINVDKCPDDKLAYLAALTNCPLIGDDPVLWRRQIKNWPFLLKIKGTELSLDLFLNSIGADVHEISTYFRDADGNLVKGKPEGEPFYDEDSGLWCNIRTHYFNFDIKWSDERYLKWYAWDKDFVNKINIWVERAKPFHAELVKIISHIDRTNELKLYHGIAEGISGYRRMYINAPDDLDLNLFHAMPQALGGYKVFWPLQPPSRIDTNIFAGFIMTAFSSLNIKVDYEQPELVTNHNLYFSAGQLLQGSRTFKTQIDLPDLDCGLVTSINDIHLIHDRIDAEPYTYALKVKDIYELVGEPEQEILDTHYAGIFFKTRGRECIKTQIDLPELISPLRAYINDIHSFYYVVKHEAYLYSQMVSDVWELVGVPERIINDVHEAGIAVKRSGHASMKYAKISDDEYGDIIEVITQEFMEIDGVNTREELTIEHQRFLLLYTYTHVAGSLETYADPANLSMIRTERGFIDLSTNIESDILDIPVNYEVSGKSNELTISIADQKPGPSGDLILTASKSGLVITRGESVNIEITQHNGESVNYKINGEGLIIEWQ